VTSSRRVIKIKKIECRIICDYRINLPLVPTTGKNG